MPAHQQQDHCITQLAFSLSEPPTIKLIVTPYKGGSSHNALSNAGNLHVCLESQVFIQDRTRNLQHEGTEEIVENMQPVWMLPSYSHRPKENKHSIPSCHIQAVTNHVVLVVLFSHIVNATTMISNLLLETMLLLWTHNFSHLISAHFPIRSYLLSDVLATSSAQSNKGEQLQACATCSKIQQVSALPRPTLSTTKLGHVERKKFCPMELLRMICNTSIQEPCNCRLQRE